MNHCERCGHNLSDHDPEGRCSHRVEYGKGRCTCDNYLRALGTLPETLGRALFTAPGRDADGSFYDQWQARKVGLLCEALLDAVPPTKNIDALELLEGWADSYPEEHRSYSLRREIGGTVHVLLQATKNGVRHPFQWTSTQSARDAAAKAIMKAGQEGHGS